MIINMEISGESEHVVANSEANYQGAEILVGTWVPALNIFETSLKRAIGSLQQRCNNISNISRIN